MNAGWLRCALVALALCAACELEVVELARVNADRAEIVVVGSVPKSAIDAFDRFPQGAASMPLALLHPLDGAAIPEGSAPIPFVWEAAKQMPPKPDDKPGPMEEPKPPPMMPDLKPKAGPESEGKPGPEGEGDIVYELHLRVRDREARVYTREPRALLPEGTWQKLVQGDGSELSIELRALSLADRAAHYRAPLQRLGVRAAPAAGQLYFRVSGALPIARARLTAAGAENLGLECRMPAFSVARAARLALRCDQRVSVRDLDSGDELGGFDDMGEGLGDLHPDGTKLVRARRNVIEIVEANGGAVASRIELDPAAQAADAVFAPDGQTIAFAYWPSAAMPVPSDAPGASIASVPASGRVGAPTILAPSMAPDLTNRFPRYTPDGQLLLFVRAKGDARKLDESALYAVAPSTGEVRPVAEAVMPRGKRSGPGAFAIVPSAQPGAYWIAFASEREAPFARPGEHPQLWAGWLDARGEAWSLSSAFWLPLQDAMTDNTDPQWGAE